MLQNIRKFIFTLPYEVITVLLSLLLGSFRSACEGAVKMRSSEFGHSAAESTRCVTRARDKDTASE